MSTRWRRPIWLDSLRLTGVQVAEELKQLRLRGPRVRESLKAVLSALLAIALGKLWHLDDLWWVAFSSFMVLRPQFGETLARGVYRIGGSMLGALLGLCLLPWLVGHPWLRVGWVMFSSALVLYLALRARYAYAWLFLILTHVMVLSFAVLLPDQVLHFAQLRIIDVILGSSACLLVSLLFEWQAQSSWAWLGPALRDLRDRRMPSLRAPLPTGVQPRLLQHVVEAGVAIAAVTALGNAIQLMPFNQASITIIAVMLLPLNDFAADRRRAVQRKLAHRCIGCVLGCLCGMLLLWLSAGWPPLWWPLLALGVWVGQHVQASKQGIGYLGTQFTLGFFTAFVHDAHLRESYLAALQRTAGILTGLLCLAIVLFAGTWLANRWMPAPANTR